MIYPSPLSHNKFDLTVLIPNAIILFSHATAMPITKDAQLKHFDDERTKKIKKKLRETDVNLEEASLTDELGKALIAVRFLSY